MTYRGNETDSYRNFIEHVVTYGQHFQIDTIESKEKEIENFKF